MALVETSAVKEGLLAPGQLVALARGERGTQLRRVNGLHALELERMDENRASLFAAGRSDEQAREDDPATPNP